MDQMLVVDRMLLPELVEVVANLVVDCHLHELVMGRPDCKMSRGGLK